MTLEATFAPSPIFCKLAVRKDHVRGKSGNRRKEESAVNGWIRIAFFVAAACLSSQAICASQNELSAYASIFQMAQEAEKNCPSTYTSDAAILILKEENHISDKDDRALKAEIAKAKAAIQHQIAEDGATKWCKHTLEQYGPKGRVLKVLITR